MSNRKSPNEQVRKAYFQDRPRAAKSEHRSITQREFLDVAFGNNPRTGKPYNTRTLRKWLANERDATRAVEHSQRDTYSFQQYVKFDRTSKQPESSVTLVKPSNRSGLDLFTPSGRRRIQRTTRAQLTEKAKKGDSPRLRDRKSTRGLRMMNARAVSHARTGTIITRRAA